MEHYDQIDFRQQDGFDYGPLETTVLALMLWVNADYNHWADEQRSKRTRSGPLCSSVARSRNGADQSVRVAEKQII